jgi:hypothetical protein
MEGSSYSLLEGTVSALAWRAKGNHENLSQDSWSLGQASRDT